MIEHPGDTLAAGLGPESDFSARKLKIAAVCLVGSIFASAMLVYGSIGLVILPMTQEFGWSRTAFCFATSAQMWCGALAVPFLGRLADRVGVRPVILVGTVVIGLATLAISFQTSSLWQLYLCFGVLGATGYSAIAYHKVVAALFTRHRAAAAGFGSNAIRSMGTYLLTRFFGLRAFTEIAGIQTAVAAVVIGLAPPLIGRAFDSSGSYDHALVLLCVGQLLATILFLRLGLYRFSTREAS